MLRISFWLTSSLLILVLAVPACGGQAGDAKIADNCSLGSETCHCTSDGTCNQGLQCLSNLCVSATGGSSSSALGAGGYAGAATSSTAGGATSGGMAPVTGGVPNAGGNVYVGAGTVSIGGHETTVVLVPPTGGALNLGGGPNTGSAPVAGGKPSMGGAAIVGGTSSACYPVNQSHDAGPNCGDGIVASAQGEGCDDGNLTSGDGCSANCQVEPNWNCPNACGPCVTTIVCGNALRQTGESCDDGNSNPGDGCDDKCKVESGWYCPVIGSPCQRLADCGTSCGDSGPGACGDGVAKAPETCDDGVNDGSYGGCTSDCQRAPYCGDGVKTGNEQCDYGSANAPPNDAPYGGCLTNCQLGPHCGDGIVQYPPEDCDDGTNNGSDNSRCTKSCRVYLLLPN